MPDKLPVNLLNLNPSRDIKMDSILFQTFVARRYDDPNPLPTHSGLLRLFSADNILLAEWPVQGIRVHHGDMIQYTVIEVTLPTYPGFLRLFSTEGMLLAEWPVQDIQVHHGDMIQYTLRVRFP